MTGRSVRRVTPTLRGAHRGSTHEGQKARAMCDHEETLTRLEAMLVSLRDQMDRLSERVDVRLADQQLAINRLRLDLARRPETRVAPQGRPAPSQ